ncbi:hypothetical protein LQ567_04930 [Niabella pedocola]|uniref:Short-chain dehydrogenase n=1 Tax=Niabella pedocola TaxID=1752077 RepID=A0ABS8PML2_9BACT|nr:hypothetical protein [Niabella pedocola]MCD2422095.1 hypothetical protein [Niabella pedocola]
MTSEQIGNAIQKQHRPIFEIWFKGRASVKGLFIKGKDYNELKLKNFWRIVDERRIAEYDKTGDQQLARVFFGDGFIKLAIPAND